MTERLVFEDDGEAWLREVLARDHAAALRRVEELLRGATRSGDGCLLTDTDEPRKVRFRGRQVAAYRFIYAVLNREVLSWNDVVRHRCHARRCINPDHLQRGDRRDNKHDDWEFAADGLDLALL